MRVINTVVFLGLFIVLLCLIVGRKEGSWISDFAAKISKYRFYMLLLLVVNSISFLMTFRQERADIYIQKEDYDGSNKEITLVLEKEDTTEEFVVEVLPIQFTQKRAEEKMEEAFAYFDENLKGDNKALSKITTDLNVSLPYEEYPFEVEVRPADYQLIDEEGNVKNSEAEMKANNYDKSVLEKGIKTEINIVLTYSDIEKEKTYEMTIYPEEVGKVKALFSSVKSSISKIEEKSRYEESLTIPAHLKGVSISEKDKTILTPANIFVFGIILIILLGFREKEEQRTKEKNRKENLIRCYPWFVNEIVLLLGAGMQVKNILLLLLSDYEKEEGTKEDSRKPLMEELEIAKQSLELGMSEEQVYYQLGRRLKIPSYIKLMTLLEQNVRKGAKGITAIFEQEEITALEERKNLAKRYGEEAGTKLLGPMMLLLLIIMLMIMIPAFLSIS